MDDKTKELMARLTEQIVANTRPWMLPMPEELRAVIKGGDGCWLPCEGSDTDAI